MYDALIHQVGRKMWQFNSTSHQKFDHTYLDTWNVNFISSYQFLWIGLREEQGTDLAYAGQTNSTVKQ